MIVFRCLLVALGVGWCAAEAWRWPDQGPQKIDSKLRFDDEDSRLNTRNVQADESREHFSRPSETEGFYNRPGEAGRYRMRVETPKHVQRSAQYSDGTLDSLQFCKCVTEEECAPRNDLPNACEPGKYLCCFKRPNSTPPNSEVFNEIDDERPMLLPHVGPPVGPFPLVPAGQGSGSRPPLQVARVPDVLVGPQGPTGIIGPQYNEPSTGPSAQRGVLVGPGGPTGVIGPRQYNYNRNPGVLVGPQGPTGVIGPGRRPAVLTGPGGPTGIIGPRNMYRRPNSGPGILVGPGGPTGTIGPGRRLLVGPGGPTGIIGPRRPYYDY